MVKFDLPLSSPASPAAERQRRKEWLIIEFLNSCMSQMQSLVQQRLPGETRSTPSSSKMLLRPPSLKDLLKPGGSDLCLSKKSSSRSGPWGSVQCFGFGKLCVERRGQLVGLQACIPLVSDVELTLQEDEPPTDFTLGDHTHMSNSSWRGCRVTVKDLLPQSGSEVGRLHSYRDVLQREQDYCSRLLHPHLLQLLAVALGSDLHTRLVFERVHIGPLHDIIHHYSITNNTGANTINNNREALPVLPVEGMLGVLLQVCEALLYLHTCKLVLRSLSSHSVLMVRPTLAKLTSLGFITSV
ncbi:inactive serine/threonine-protein kinase TEX14-like [Alosa alosa]|uniref:inactive serine/threonine-protein kinase TEX14-like n=1 Tax=Alosa alosa TaxID=278164 RepID=UPI00201509D9|nr:inactive serine/threonine-protein kinase TEX14-like [Alosa alosa]